MLAHVQPLSMSGVYRSGEVISKFEKKLEADQSGATVVERVYANQVKFIRVLCYNRTIATRLHEENHHDKHEPRPTDYRLARSYPRTHGR